MMMELRLLGIDGVIEVIPKKLGDARGYFAETYTRGSFQRPALPRTGFRTINPFRWKRACCGGFISRSRPLPRTN